jgi:uncharacterized membrane protein YdbT with pleckstrin-like domain
MTAKKHWFSLFPAVLQLLCALVVIFLSGHIVSLFGAIHAAPKVIRIFVFILAYILVYSAFQNYFIYFSTELGFTDKRLIGKVGLFRVRSLLTPLNKINNISGFSGFFGRIFKYGSIQVFSSSGQFVYDYVVNHDEFMIALLEQIDIYERDVLNHDPKSHARAAKAPSKESPELAKAEDKKILDFERNASLLGKAKGHSKKKDEPPQKDSKLKEENPPSEKTSISHCPFCKAPYTVTPEMDGRLSQCTKCKKQFVIKTTESA